jgi:hypothetical protein
MGEERYPHGSCDNQGYSLTMPSSASPPSSPRPETQNQTQKCGGREGGREGERVPLKKRSLPRHPLPPLRLTLLRPPPPLQSSYDASARSSTDGLLPAQEPWPKRRPESRKRRRRRRRRRHGKVLSLVALRLHVCISIIPLNRLVNHIHGERRRRRIRPPFQSALLRGARQVARFGCPSKYAVVHLSGARKVVGRRVPPRAA